MLTAVVMTGSFSAVVLFAALWLRSRSADAALNRRLERVAATLTREQVEDRPAEVKASVFRSQRVRSRVYEWLEGRFCMLEGREPFPKAAVAGIVAVLAAEVVANLMQFGLLVLLLAGVGAGAGGAWLFLSAWDARVRAEFVKQFPEVADQVVRLARAGLPAMEAISAVAVEAPEPSRRILRSIADQLSSGLDPESVLHEIAANIRISEFTLFAAALVLQRTTGGSLSATLGNLSATVRARMEVDAKAHASTAQTRMTLWVLTLVPVVVLGSQGVTDSEMVEMFLQTESGATLLRWGCGLIVAGLVVARAIGARISR